MHHWNHRVIKRTYPSVGNIEAETLYGIYEVHYENAKPIMCTVNPVEVQGESIEEIRETLQWMLDCLNNPVLDYDKDFSKKENDF